MLSGTAGIGTALDADALDARFTAWRARELARVDRQGLTYLDYTGAALYPASLVAADAARLTDAVLGNPHSASAPSRAATDALAEARAAILAFLNADPAEYTVVLTANTTGACRLVGESFPFGPGSALALAADNHNSVNGMREHATWQGAALFTVPLDDELRLRDVEPVLDAPQHGSRLFAFPAQSNFSGVRHPLALVERARAQGWRVFVDAAALLPTADLDLARVKPDFTCLSLYKVAGYPAGVGALVTRHDALAELRRPSFSGGTVRWVSVQHQRHLLARGAEGFEDGTPPFVAAGAVVEALGSLRAHGRECLGVHLAHLTTRLLDGLAQARHSNGAPRVRVYGPRTTVGRGATVAFNLLTPAGDVVPYWEVEEEARAAGIAIRGGCFCNPGCSEHAFGFGDRAVMSCLEGLGDAFTIPRFGACLGGAVGALRASMGSGSVRRDVERLLGFVDARR
ncbi:MAG: aminotransferase class V-fold PLP-dependent enzyme [Gemmatimonadetes bacterium]|nr:aminotransferase class V-fold PLP-dependent enzyme [Gemmatimonadota bacterium]